MVNDLDHAFISEKFTINILKKEERPYNYDWQIDLAEKCSAGVFEHYISLGQNCPVARELEELGLRDSSMPFDWNFTEWKGIVRSFETRFNGYLKYEKLYQKKSNHGVYKNIEYGVSFVHDFNSKKPLKSQIKKVKRKYSRRIERFFNYISRPTFFIRYCYNQEELNEIVLTYPKIIKMVKSYNQENEIVFISVYRSNNPGCSEIENIYFIENAPDGKENSTPISSAPNLYQALLTADYPKRKENLDFLKRKTAIKKKSFVYRITKKLKKLFPSKKDYIHTQQC